MTRNRRTATGFTLVEMLVVVALIGIVASIAMPAYKNSTTRARESVLREDLWVLRDLINQYHADKGKYPASLEDLVESGYLHKIPVDPITKSADTWVTIMDEPPPDAPEEDEEETEPGITDVQSGATGVGLDGTDYSSW